MAASARDNKREPAMQCSSGEGCMAEHSVACGLHGIEPGGKGGGGAVAPHH